MSNMRRFFSYFPLFFAFLFATIPTAQAATYYIAPGGDFGAAISKLNPGDTLLLKDGSYPSSNPFIRINCGGFAGTAGQKNAKSGMPGAPITLKAEHERQAFFQKVGLEEIIYMSGCSYWIIEGITLQSHDQDPGKVLAVGGIDIKHSNHITVRRILANHSNRYVNGDIEILLNYVDDSLIEENEFYNFHRHATINKYGDRNVFRRNYANARDYPSIPDGWHCHYLPAAGNCGATGGGELVSIYPGNNVITENNIAERTGGMIDEQSIASSTNNRQFGNIGLNVHIFTHLQRRPKENPGPGSQNSYVENIVGIGEDNGIIERGGTGSILNHISIFGTQANGISADAGALIAQYGPSPLPLSTHVTNSLITGAGGYGVYFAQQDSFGVDHSNLINNAHDFYPASSPTYTNNMSKDPGMGSCKVFIPDGSPMKGVGQNGEDIGANVICRYQDGVLQVGNPLWDPATGKFPCGAIYHGINDKPGESCFDVNVRLNVNANGCQLPPASSCKPVQLPDFPPVVGGPLPPGTFLSPDGKVCPSGYPTTPTTTTTPAPAPSTGP